MSLSIGKNSSNGYFPKHQRLTEWRILPLRGVGVVGSDVGVMSVMVVVAVVAQPVPSIVPVVSAAEFCINVLRFIINK